MFIVCSSGCFVLDFIVLLVLFDLLCWLFYCLLVLLLFVRCLLVRLWVWCDWMLRSCLWGLVLYMLSVVWVVVFLVSGSFVWFIVLGFVEFGFWWSSFFRFGWFWWLVCVVVSCWFCIICDAVGWLLCVWVRSALCIH